MRRTEPDRGLPSLTQSRHERKRALISGKVRVRAMPPYFWLWALVVLSAVLIIYWWFAQRALVEMKAQVMAKQRAVASVLGPKLVPFTEKIEQWAKDLASGSAPTALLDSWDYEAVAQASGTYLRVRIENARESRSLRKAAQRSLHDGFTSCFFRSSRGYDPSQGAHCRTSAECKPHLLCNEYDRCTEPPRPYNMRLAYRALRVLSTQWTDELHLAESDLGVKARARDLESVTHHDVPIAVDLLAHARYATIVLDEPPPGGLPPEKASDEETSEERLQRLPHFARIGIWRIADGALLLRFRGWAEGRLVAAGVPRDVSAEVDGAQARQANSCSLALQVRTLTKPGSPPE